MTRSCAAIASALQFDLDGRSKPSTVQVVMPAMGDSVAEGTVLEWHKQEGDRSSADETLVEISTDKVDAEVPSPVAGTLVKIHAAEGDTVAVGALLAEIAPTVAAPIASASGDERRAGRPDGDGTEAAVERRRQADQRPSRRVPPAVPASAAGRRSTSSHRPAANL